MRKVKWHKLLGLVLSTALVATSLPQGMMTAKAEEAVTVSAGDVEEVYTEELPVYGEFMQTEKTIAVNGTVAGSIAESGEYDMYHFTLPSAGEFSIEMTSQMDYYCIWVYDSNGNVVGESLNNAWNANVQKVVNTHVLHLTAGDYSIKVNSCRYRNYEKDLYYTGTYSVKTNLVSAGETFPEPNNDFTSAKTIALNASVKGQIAHNDGADYFKFNVTTPGRLTLDTTTYMNYYSMYIYNSDGEEIISWQNNAWNENLKTAEYSHLVDLSVGTYYLLVDGVQHRRWDPDVYHKGNYNFKMSFQAAGVSYSAADDEFTSAYKYTLGKKITGHLAVNDGQDIIMFTLSRAEDLSLNMTSYMEKYYIEVFNVKGERIHTIGTCSWNATLGFVTNEHGLSLDKGTYYLKVSADGTTGKYVLDMFARIPLTDTKISAMKNQVYNGKERTPAPTITYKNKKLVKDKDYTVTYTNNINVGVASATITGIGKYTGTVTKTFKITPLPISKAKFGKIKAQIYTGSAITPELTVKYNGKLLYKDVDYKLSYKNNKNVGTATITIKGIGSYNGTKKIEFKINPTKISSASFGQIKDFVYTGKALKPSVSATFNDKKLKANKDYTLSYKANKKVGVATVTITGKGNFKGTKSLTFNILPKKPTLSKVTNSAKGKAKLTWKKDASVSGYEIHRSYYKDWGYSYVGTVGNKTTYTDNNVWKGNTYYYKIRPFKKINGKTLYGEYSAPKSVKIKK